MSNIKRDKYGYASCCVRACVRACAVFFSPVPQTFKRTIAFRIQTNYLPQLNYLIYITVQFGVLGVV
jgi:hypothetical protein